MSTCYLEKWEILLQLKRLHLKVNFPSIIIIIAFRESASCTHISALLHALVAMRPGPESGTPVSAPLTTGDSDDDENLPVMSFTCQWKAPRKRKESTLKFADTNFAKHVYGWERKHHWKSITDFDPRLIEHRGTAPRLMQGKRFRYICIV